MCKTISSEAIIGNFMIEMVEKNNFEMQIDNLIVFEKKLSKQLKKHEYFTKFDFIQILDFKENFPFFVDNIDENFLIIKQNDQDSIKLTTQLSRYFRLGMPKLVIDEIKNISREILG